MRKLACVRYANSAFCRSQDFVSCEPLYLYKKLHCTKKQEINGGVTFFSVATAVSDIGCVKSFFPLSMPALLESRGIKQ